MKQYFKNIILWFFDIGFNVVFLGGSPYETISSRVGRQADKKVPWACKVCDFLSSIFGPNHCKRSYVDDQGKTLPNWWKNL